MSFRDREKTRLEPLKEHLFSRAACQPGFYPRVRRSYCLHEDQGQENLHESVRQDALRYFAKRRITWHDGYNGEPSNHLCCSQSCCVNFWFPFVRAPQELAAVLREIGYDVDEVLPFIADEPFEDGVHTHVAFEWIGTKNYLRERAGGRVASDDGRTRGANFTSLDFAMRFRRSDGRIHLLAGEWKYTEEYPRNKSKRRSRNTDRLDIYRPHLEAPECQIKPGLVEHDALFYDPFDQLMRQQLLCSAMERDREMGADVVSLLHVAPKSNRDLLNRITSPGLEAFGNDIHGVWSTLTLPERFKGVYLEDLLVSVRKNAPNGETGDYLWYRYGGTT